VKKTIDWDTSLITLYLVICNAYQQKLWAVCQRFTNGGYKRFTDEEIMTIYIQGNLKGFKTIKQIHTYVRHYLLSLVNRIDSGHPWASGLRPSCAVQIGKHLPDYARRTALIMPTIK